MKFKYEVGQCLNCSGGICSTGKYQNYCCPFVFQKKCPRYIPITQKMIDHFEKYGYIVCPAPTWEGIGEPTKH